MTEKEWEKYITFSDWKVRTDVANSKTTPLWVLERMVTDEDIWVLYALIKNPKTTSKMLDKIMEVALFRNYCSIPEAISLHSKCSEETLIKWCAYDNYKGHLRNCHNRSPQDSDFLL